MADPSLFRLRVVFRKAGRLAMLSHLEVARALERAVRRAQLPYAVSQGFSPHMRIAFGAALPVGVGGTHEFFDLFLMRYVPCDQALERLQSASADDLAPVSCAYVEPSAPAASVAFPISGYEVRLSRPLAQMCVVADVTVVRKKKEKTLAVPEYLVGDVALEGDVVRFELEAKPTGSLRPDVFARACVAATRESDPSCADVQIVSITRVSQRTASGSALLDV